MEGSGNGDGSGIADLADRPDVRVLPTAPEESDFRRSRRARVIRRIFLALLAAFLAVGLTGRLGVLTQEVTAEAGGYELTVTYGKVTRPGLPTPWEFEVRHPGGFDGPITVATTSEYLKIFDENTFDPEPSNATSTEDVAIWEFEPPPSDTLAVSLDARIEPGVQWGRSGETAVLVAGKPVVIARYHTWVLP